MATINPGSWSDRNACLTVAVGSAGASEFVCQNGCCQALAFYHRNPIALSMRMSHGGVYGSVGVSEIGDVKGFRSY
jgi:hypothetical protein